MVGRFTGLIVATAVFGLLVSAQLAIAAPQADNLYKDIMDKKGSIQWKTAPDNAIPSDVCTIVQACAGTAKVAVLPASTEGGQKLERGLFLSPTGDKTHPEALILEHYTAANTYYFLLGSDGNLQKTAFFQFGAKSWVAMANSLGKATFDKDKTAWVAWVTKPAAAPAAAAKPAASN